MVYAGSIWVVCVFAFDCGLCLFCLRCGRCDCVMLTGAVLSFVVAALIL